MFDKFTHTHTLLTVLILVVVFAGLVGLGVLPLSTDAATTTVSTNDIGNYDDWTCVVVGDPDCFTGKGDAVQQSDGDDSYIAGDTNKEIQTFGFREAGIPFASVVNSVTVEVVAKRVGGSKGPASISGNGAFSIVAERGTGSGELYLGPVITPTTNYETYTLVLPTNPFTKEPWTVEEVNRPENHGIHFGVARTNASLETRVTKVSLIVDYDPSTPNPNSITIVTIANPQDGTDFEFDAFGSGTFFLDDANPDDGDKVTDRKTFNNLTPGTYTFTESIPTGWFVQNLWCEGDLDNGTTDNDFQGIVNVDLDAGEEIYCVYDNTTNPPA